MEDPTGWHGAGQPALADPAVARGFGPVDFTQSFPTWVIVGLCDCRQMSCFFQPVLFVLLSSPVLDGCQLQ